MQRPTQSPHIGSLATLAILLTFGMLWLESFGDTELAWWFGIAGVIVSSVGLGMIAGHAYLLVRYNRWKRSQKLAQNPQRIQRFRAGDIVRWSTLSHYADDPERRFRVLTVYHDPFDVNFGSAGDSARYVLLDLFDESRREAWDWQLAKAD